MRVAHWLLGGFVATLVLSTLMSAAQGLRLTRMSLPYLLGTAFTPDRDKAKLVGFAVHLFNGWIFALIYGGIFRIWGEANWWRGALIGLGQSAFVLTAGMALIPALHPRMASEDQGPTVVRQLEPPGFLALNYGARTPISVVIGHVAYGILLGVIYGAVH